jgi:hypothetical protein
MHQISNSFNYAFFFHLPQIAASFAYLHEFMHHPFNLYSFIGCIDFFVFCSEAGRRLHTALVRSIRPDAGSHGIVVVAWPHQDQGSAARALVRAALFVWND